MVMRALSRLLRPPAVSSLVGSAEGFTQTIRLERATLAHVFRHRQISPWATEAGGQLFGLVDDNIVRVIRATGPYAGDERSRYRYRSDPAAAQLAIEVNARSGLLYLGEWHSHDEDHPTVSSLDKDAMVRLMASSRLNSNALLMLIVGRVAMADGLALFSVAPDTVQSWTLVSLPGH